MQKKIIFFLFVLVLFALTFFFRTASSATSLSTWCCQVKKIVASSGNHYTFYYNDKAKLLFTTSRPNKTDSNIFLCIPAAFTRADNKVDGFYMENGIASNLDSINFSLGGAISICNDSVNIFPTNKGKIFTKIFIDSFSKNSASVFQQIQMIKNFKAEVSKSKRKMQCRGIVILNSNQVCIVESNEAITLQTFADDLAGQKNVKNLLYTDMGAWDEGWYRNDKNKIIRIGKDFSSTKFQTNWVILKRRIAKK